MGNSTTCHLDSGVSSQVALEEFPASRAERQGQRKKQRIITEIRRFESQDFATRFSTCLRRLQRQYDLPACRRACRNLAWVSVRHPCGSRNASLWTWGTNP